VNPAFFAHRGLQVCTYQKDQAGAKAFLAKIKDPKDNWEVKWWRNPIELSEALHFAEFGRLPNQ
jgi:hypothetical protein